MRGVRDEAPALLLVLLQALGEGVELALKLADLVVARDLVPVGIVAAGDRVHAARQTVKAPQDDPRERRRQQQSGKADGEREKDDAVLDRENDGGAFGVDLGQADRADHGAAAADGDGDAAGKGRIGKDRAEHAFPGEGRLQVLQIRRILAVVENDAAALIDDDDPVEAGEVQKAQHVVDTVLAEPVQRTEGRGDDRDL